MAILAVSSSVHCFLANLNFICSKAPEGGAFLLSVAWIAVHSHTDRFSSVNHFMVDVKFCRTKPRPLWGLYTCETCVQFCHFLILNHTALLQLAVTDKMSVNLTLSTNIKMHLQTRQATYLTFFDRKSGRADSLKTQAKRLPATIFLEM